jgi:hypothetical protein
MSGRAGRAVVEQQENEQRQTNLVKTSYREPQGISQIWEPKRRHELHHLRSKREISQLKFSMITTTEVTVLPPSFD